MSDHLATEADRLSNDAVFLKALNDIRTDTLNALVTADADKYIDIVRLQQKVAVIDEIRAMLARYIMAAGQVQDETSPYA